MNEQNDVPKLLRGHRVLIVVGICLLLTVFLFWNETRDSEISFADISWTSTSVFFLVVALIMMAFRDIAYMVRIRALTDYALSWRQSFNVIMIWEFASALSPGIVGGSTVAMFILKGEKIPLGRSTAIVIITAVMDNLFYIIALPLLFLFISAQQLFPPDLSWIEEGGLIIFWIGYSAMLGVTALLFVSVFFYPKILAALIKVIFKLPFLNRRKYRGLKIALDIHTASVEFKGKSLSFWLNIFAITVWSWTSRFMVINLMLMAFIELGLGDHFVILGRQLVMWLVLIIPSTPGGSGLAELLFSNFLSDFILNGMMALSLAFLWRILSYYPYLVIGSIIYPRWMRR